MSEPTSAAGTARAVVQHLLDLGVREAVVAPGSRSGPLALALAQADREGALRLHVRLDERTAGFLALGMAKASRRPVPVLTTSGTAVANLHPAMLEALHTGVRLVALTADRPGRLRGTGANQTTDQRHIFPGVRYLEDVRDLDGSPGPVQLNVELDEPLLQGPSEGGYVRSDADVPRRHARAATPVRLASGPRTVVVAGDDAGPAARVVAEAGGWPLLAEPSSGARTGTHALATYRLLLAHSPLAERIERVVSFGHPTLSRPVARLLARADVEVVHVGTEATFPVAVDERVRLVDGVEVEAADPADWLDAWRAADASARTAVDGFLAADPGLAPYEVARAVSAAVPPGGLLVVGSSNPIRDLDVMAAPYPVGERRLVLANRGLAGIDGTISTALGAALGRPGPALAYLGDLTFLHDANGLLAGPAEPRPDLTLVVASDDGGSIFHTLEQGAPEYAEDFERVFGTPTGVSIAAVCAAYGVAHETATSEDGLATALARAASGVRVVEVPLRRDRRREQTAALSAAVRDAVG